MHISAALSCHRKFLPLIESYGGADLSPTRHLSSKILQEQPCATFTCFMFGVYVLIGTLKLGLGTTTGKRKGVSPS